MSDHSIPASRSDALRFARAWADAWNRRDLDAVLAHFADDVVFESPKAIPVTGGPRVEGLRALRAYWQARLEKNVSLQFEIEDVVLDTERPCVVILYRSLINGNAQRVAEQLQFGADGRICFGAAYHGVPLAPPAAR